MMTACTVSTDHVFAKEGIAKDGGPLNKPLESSGNHVDHHYRVLYRLSRARSLRAISIVHAAATEGRRWNLPTTTDLVGDG